MGFQDLDARFNAVSAGQGTIASEVVAGLHSVARDLNDRVDGEPHQLSTVLQAIETAAHQARLYLDFTESEQPGRETDPPAENPYAGLPVKELEAAIRQRNKGRDEGEQLAVSGTKDELVDRLLADDRRVV